MDKVDVSPIEKVKARVTAVENILELAATKEELDIVRADSAIIKERLLASEKEQKKYKEQFNSLKDVVLQLSAQILALSTSSKTDEKTDKLKWAVSNVHSVPVFHYFRTEKRSARGKQVAFTGGIYGESECNHKNMLKREEVRGPLSSHVLLKEILLAFLKGKRVQVVTGSCVIWMDRFSYGDQSETDLFVQSLKHNIKQLGFTPEVLNENGSTFMCV